MLWAAILWSVCPEDPNFWQTALITLIAPLGIWAIWATHSKNGRLQFLVSAFSDIDFLDSN